MVRQVIWTERAQKDRITIYTYWNERNRSNNYSKRLNKLILDIQSFKLKLAEVSDKLFKASDMKKLCIYTLILILPLISKGQMQIGLKGGYTYYWLTTHNEGHYKAQYIYSHNAFLAAATLSRQSSEEFNYGIEIEYTNRTFEVKSSWGGLGSVNNVDFNYTIGNIYIQIRPQFSFGKDFKFFFYPGVYVGTMLHSSLKGTKYFWTGWLPPVTDTLNGNAKGYYPDFEFGLSPGIGIEYPISNNINFVFEYNFSMNIFSIGEAWENRKAKMLNMNFEVGLAYKFRKNKSGKM